MATHAVQFEDSDGIPPGLDLQLTGQKKLIKFTGRFYGLPGRPEIELTRPVQIIFASPEVYVAMDMGPDKNLYVVDRLKSLSLGCRMTAELIDVPSSFNPHPRTLPH